MCNGVEISFEDGWVDFVNYVELIWCYIWYIELVVKVGYCNLICFSGNCCGMSDDIGFVNCEMGLCQILFVVEVVGVILMMELLNLCVNYLDYLCDRLGWGVVLVQCFGLLYFKLLFDIYYMQIMEGDVICMIIDYYWYFGYYYIVGNLGWYEFDDMQELNYLVICWVIYVIGFQGYVVQEFIFSSDDLGRVEVVLCDVVLICDI